MSMDDDICADKDQEVLRKILTDSVFKTKINLEILINYGLTLEELKKY